MPVTADIQIRDPFVLTLPDRGVSYLFGSTDLQTWEGPIAAFRPPTDFWSDRNF